MSDLREQSRKSLVAEIKLLHDRLDLFESIIKKLDEADPKKAELENIHFGIAQHAANLKKHAAAIS
jgi:hypothetical protein